MSKPKTAGTTCRYQEGLDGVWYLTVYGDTSGELPSRQAFGETFDTRPKWLPPILDVAAAADAFMKPADPPPYRVLWFVIDSNYNLLRFGRE